MVLGSCPHSEFEPILWWQMLQGLWAMRGCCACLVLSPSHRILARVLGLLYSLLHIPIHKDAKIALLHCRIQGLFSYQQMLASYLVIAAKRALARAWKKPSVSFAMVKSIFTDLIINEKITSILHDTHSKFQKNMVVLLWLCSPHPVPKQPGSLLTYALQLPHSTGLTLLPLSPLSLSPSPLCLPLSPFFADMQLTPLDTKPILRLFTDYPPCPGAFCGTECFFCFFFFLMQTLLVGPWAWETYVDLRFVSLCGPSVCFLK